jgi:hypothetical protein
MLLLPLIFNSLLLTSVLTFVTAIYALGGFDKRNYASHSWRKESSLQLYCYSH